MVRLALAAVIGVRLVTWSLALHAQSAPVAQFQRVADGTITVDGKLDEAAWSHAPPLTRFYEVFPGNDTPPRAATAARFLFDDRALYVGIHMDEPDPTHLRGQFVERDHVSDGQDYIEVFIDALGSGRGAQYFRTDLRGVQTDGHYSETSESENNAPDYRWQVATSRDGHGWTAEFRIPFATLRHVTDGSLWSLLVYRGRPRTDSVQDASAKLPRDASCFVCLFDRVQGLSPPAPRPSWWVAPDVVVRAGAPTNGFKPDFGVTGQWQSGRGQVLDITVNPDFSEVEADAIQVTGNARFTQSLPEKRPFFMESLDLLAGQPDLDRPLQPIYTRDIADPDLGVRITGRAASHDYTALIARDAGGGLLRLPGPFSTAEVPQERESDDFMGRYVQNLPKLALGGVLTDREYLGGGFNRVMGGDANWHPTVSDNINAEALASATHDPVPIDNTPTRRHGTDIDHSLAGYAKWAHLGSAWTWDALVQQVGDGFRADLGFVPAAGFRAIKADLGKRWFDVGAFSELRPTLTVENVQALDGHTTIVRSIYPGMFFTGPHGFYGTIELHLAEHARADAGLPLRNLRFLRVNLAARPGSSWPLASVSGDVGQQLDLVTGQVREGGALALESDFRPLGRLEIDLRLTRSWLRADASDPTSRRLLLDQRGEQLRVLWHFSVADELRLQALRETDAAVSGPTATARSASLLFLHRAGWHSAWYAGVSHSEDPQFPDQRGWEVLAKWTYAYGAN